jgi:hypothetical protein
MIPDVDLKSVLPSLLRTVVPVVVAYLLGTPVVRALGLSDEHVTALVTAALTLAYWAVVRALETYVAPQLGWLLGWGAAPVYVPPAEAGKSATPAQDVVRVVTDGP